MLEVLNPGRAPLSTIVIILVIAITSAPYLGTIDTYGLALNKQAIFERHEFWRLITGALSMGGITWDTVLFGLFFFNNLAALERQFGTRSFDFLVFLLIGISTSVFVCLRRNTPFATTHLNTYISYLMVRKRGQLVVGGVMGVAAVPAGVLLVLSGLGMKAKDFSNVLLCVFAAHLYFFLDDVCGLRYDRHFTHGPECLNRWVHRFLHVIV